MTSDEFSAKAKLAFENTKTWIDSLSYYTKAGMIIGLGIGLAVHSPIGGLLAGFGVGYLCQHIKSQSDSSDQ